MHIRALTDTEVIQLERDRLQALVQSDAELGDILMRAFIFRRLEMVKQGVGDVVLLGSAHSASTLRIQEFLARNGHPYCSVPSISTAMPACRTARSLSGRGWRRCRS